MEKVFVSPSRYVQGPGVLRTSLSHIEKIGKSAILLADDFVWKICGEQLSLDLIELGLKIIHVPFNGEASYKEINRITEIGRTHATDMVIGLGGGKTIDVAKAIGDEFNQAVVILPTVASTDAPTSAISVIYSEQGLFEKYVYYKKSPTLVMVDTEIICQAPPHLLASGIADALATKIEADAVRRHQGKNLAGGRQTLAALAIAEKCEAVLFEFGIQAFEDNKKHQLTDAFEDVVEANTLLSGIGFESGGLAGAHAIHNGFSVLKGEIEKVSHGGKVAYGILVQLVLEEQTEKFETVLTFLQQLSLPTTLEDIHLEHASKDDFIRIGKHILMTNDTIKYVSDELRAEDIAEAILKVDSLVKSKNTQSIS